MFLANFIFIFSCQIIRPAVHLNTTKAQRHCSQKEKFVKYLLAFVILIF